MKWSVMAEGLRNTDLTVYDVCEDTALSPVRVQTVPVLRNGYDFGRGPKRRVHASVLHFMWEKFRNACLRTAKTDRIATYWAFLGNMIYAPYCISMVT
jgi:hypothetical protein